ncbi:MAG: SPOR domain-containing protein [Desulfatitalea sp.]
MAEEQAKYAVRMTRKGLLAWGAVILFFMGWMFVLGILVGRGIAPVPIDTHALEKELAELKESLLQKEHAEIMAQAQQSQENDTELGFYEALKRPPLPTQPKPKPSPTPAAVAKPDPADTATRVKQSPTAATAPTPAKPKPTVAATPAPKPKPTPKPEGAAKPESAATPAPTPVVSPSPTPSPGKGRFTIQVASFRDIQSADQLVSTLRGKGYSAYQLRTDVADKGVWFRVRVGAYESRSGAEGTLKKLLGDRFKAVVVGTD